MLTDCGADFVGIKNRLLQVARHGLNNHDAQTLLLILIAEGLERLEKRMAGAEAPAAEPAQFRHKQGAGRPPKYG